MGAGLLCHGGDQHHKDHDPDHSGEPEDLLLSERPVRLGRLLLGAPGIRGLLWLQRPHPLRGRKAPEPTWKRPGRTAVGGGDTVPVKLGVWISNTKTWRTKLTEAQLTALAELGLDWR
ncbi:hypothetical protein ACIGXM_31665 [Kitasatospora sp. NPDC052896]|uniref:hypothetical protein n=1 Tax=Kitasatospora sp. NPDC052896 TaxID=3364061 RepID=UPI0037C904F1